MNFPDKKLLIYDEDEATRETLKDILGDQYSLVLTKDGSQCFDCLSKSKDIGLLLMDIKTSSLGGMDILKQIIKEFPSLKIVIITGHKNIINATEAVRLGASGYLVKPLKSEEMLAIVKNQLV